MLFLSIIIILNAFFSVNRATCLFLKTFININASFSFNHYFKPRLIKKFERFKERVKSEFEITIYNINVF